MPDSRSAVAGRLVCDVKISAMELIRARSYDIASLASQVLGFNEDQISSYTGAELRGMFDSSGGIQHLAAWGMSLGILNLRLVNELQVMPLALQITTIAGK
jgi:DNA polymerase alpha subunit A